MDASRVRAYLGLVGSKDHVHVVTYGAGFDPYLPPTLLHLHAVPVALDLNQNPISYGLAGETGARSSKGEGNLAFPAVEKEFLNLVRGARQHHRLRNEPVEAGIRGEGDEIDRTMENPLLRNEPHQLFPHPFRRAARGTWWHATRWRLIRGFMYVRCHDALLLSGGNFTHD